MHAIKVVEHLLVTRPEFASAVWDVVQAVDSVESVNIRRSMIRMVA